MTDTDNAILRLAIKVLRSFYWNEKDWRRDVLRFGRTIYQEGYDEGWGANQSGSFIGLEKLRDLWNEQADEFNDWSTLDLEEKIHWANFCLQRQQQQKLLMLKQALHKESDQ